MGAMHNMAKYSQLALGNRFPDYVTTVQINGRDFIVQVDTGSSDLWVISTPDFQFNTTGSQRATVSYGDGSSVTGPVGFAAVQLGDYAFSPQAFLNASETQGSAALPGTQGLIGLAFNGAANTEVQKAVGPDVGQPFLFNIFDQTPDQDNFIGIALSRTDDLEDSADASFTINELDPNYTAIENMPKIPVFPGAEVNGRWTFVVDSIDIDGVDIPLTSEVPGTPDGKFVALMDTGTTLGSLPPDVFYALYSNIPGALVGVVGTGPNDFTFIIPCNTTSMLTVVIGGNKYPIHPLDLSQIVNISDDNGNNVTVCVSALSPSPASPSDLDSIFGDTIMHNVYTVFNFGDAVSKSPMKNSSMQVLSLTDPQSAIADVLSVRMAQFASLPPELQGTPSGFAPAPPGSTLNSTLGALPQPGSDSSSSSGDGVSSTSDALTKNLASTNGGDSTSTTTSDPVLRKYALIIIGLLGGNLLLVIVLVVIGVALCLKKGARRVRQGGNYAPVKLPAFKAEGEPFEGGDILINLNAQ
ncbi:aspartic peptidase domain-containing protein [Mycena galopus ATCC 62051]|nr:aspartic peptidase domain-containing protein [Mycena galopus ATCC 62051]